MQVQGKKALVTGANRGLGKAIALELAGRGFEVIAGVREPASAQALLDAAKSLKGSIELQRIDLAALGEYQPPPGLNVLINNAGYRGPYLPIEVAGMDEWRRTFDTNFFGLIDLTRRAIPSLRDSGGGVICNIGSMGVYTPFPFYSIYRASKAAVEAVSEGLRMELAPFGIRVIEIPIGGVDTDMLKTSIARRPPEAVGYELYRPMAEAQAAMGAKAPLQAASPEQAARNIADELFREGPLLRPCDPNAVTGMEYVTSSTGAERAEAMLARYEVKAP